MKVKEEQMTNQEYIGVINLIIKMLENKEPRKKIIKYLKELKKNK